MKRQIDKEVVLSVKNLIVKFFTKNKVVNAVNEKCLNGNRAQLITFSSSEGRASAKFKCW